LRAWRPVISVLAINAYRATIGAAVLVVAFLLLSDPSVLLTISPSSYLVLAISVLLAMVAGYVDAYGFISYRTYLSFMSGNTTQTGFLTGQGHVAAAMPIVSRPMARAAPVMALVTSAGRRHAVPTLAGLGLLGLFTVIVAGDEVTVGKPDPEGYRRASDELGVVPARCVAFEDSPAGLAAARAAGMYCVAVTTTHPRSELTGADQIVADLTEITWPVVA
jgi:hypothetical protein